MPALNFSRPNPVLIVSCRCEMLKPSPPDNALRKLMTSRGPHVGQTLPPGVNWDQSSPPGRRKVLPLLPLLLLKRRSDPPLGTLFSLAPTFPRPWRARCRQKAACCHIHLRHADDTLLNILASVASRVWPLCLVDDRRVYTN